MTALQRKYWGHAVYLVFFIYAALPVARPIGEFLRKFIPLHFTINFLTLSILISGLVIFLRKTSVKKISTYFFFFLFFAAYTLILVAIKIPEEKIHFSEYGFLSFLMFRALRLSNGEHPSYFLAFVLTAFLGWADEGIQHLLPGRYYDLKDVFFNLIGGFLGLWVTFVVRREREAKLNNP